MIKIWDCLVCDGCGELGDYYQHPAARFMRADAKKCGWIYRNGKDFCSECAKESK